jgi:hypothetical protein
VLVVVGDEVLEGEPVVTGDEVEAVHRGAVPELVQVAGPGEPAGHVAEDSRDTGDEPAEGVPEPPVPLAPAGAGEVPDLVEARGVPGLGHHLGVGQGLGQLDVPDHRRVHQWRAVLAPGQDRSLVEPEPVDVYVLHPVGEAVQDELVHDGVVAAQRVPTAGVVHVVLAAAHDRVVVGRVVDALERERRTQVVALGGVVEHHVEDHLDPGLVQCLDHVPELVDVAGRVAAGAVAGVRGEVGQRGVTPVVRQRPAGHGVGPAHVGRVELQRGHQLDRRDAEVDQVADPLDHPAEGAGGRDVRRPGEAANVQLVDHRLRHRPEGPDVALPVVGVHVDDDPAQRALDVVALPAGRAPVPPPDLHRTRVGVEQHLAGVEPVAVTLPRLRIRRAVHAQGVAGSGTQPVHEHVPEVEGAVLPGRQGHHLGGLRVERVVEEQQLHPGRALGVDREVHALRGDGGPDRVGPARGGRCGRRVWD